MLEFLGHDVIRENHIGDWGRPFGMLIEHLLDIGEDVAAEGLGQGDLDGFYKQANAKFTESDEFQARARDRVVHAAGRRPGDDRALAAPRRHVERLLQHGLRQARRAADRRRPGGREPLPAADARGATSGSTPPGCSSESDGAKVVFPPGFTNRDNEPLPLIVRSSAGAFMYATSDLACVLDRVERLGADLLLYVIGAPQAQHLQMVFEVVEMAGWLQPPTEAVHVGVRQRARRRPQDAAQPHRATRSSSSSCSTRRSNGPRPRSPRRTPTSTATSAPSVARMIGIGAVKYADLSTDRIKDYVFDWDRMLAFDGNTGAVPAVRPRPDLLDLPARRRRPGDGARRTRSRSANRRSGRSRSGCSRTRRRSTDTLDDATRRTSCAPTCSIWRRTSRRSTSTARCCKADEPIRTSRLALCDVTARTLEHGLGLLGIDAPGGRCDGAA